jgi:hypothetical protein
MKRVAKVQFHPLEFLGESLWVYQIRHTPLLQSPTVKDVPPITAN